MVRLIPYPSRPIKPKPFADGSYDLVEILVWHFAMQKYYTDEDAYQAYVESLSDAEYNEFYELP